MKAASTTQHANHASIPLCDFTLGLSDKPEVIEGTGCPLPGTCCLSAALCPPRAVVV